MIIAFMGTMIVLSLNEVPVDYGKNHCWVSHAWLFPPGSDKDVRHVYADDVVEVRPGLSAALEQVRFRMDHLGYSLDEVRDRYNCELERWNRTYTLCLPFERFLAAVISIDFVGMAQDSQGGFEYDLATLLLRFLESTDPQGDDWRNLEGKFSGIDDFVRERIPVHVLVRCLAERPANRALPLTWGYQDLIESGWEARSTLMEIDRTQSMLNMIRLYGRLQDQAGHHSIADFDRWLADHGVPQDTSYIKRINKGKDTKKEQLTLPSAVRNMIHHPENREQILTDEQLEQAIELLLQVALSVETSTRSAL